LVGKVGFAGFSDSMFMKTHSLMLAGILFFAAFIAIAEASRTSRVELWRGIWITLPDGAKIERVNPTPIARVKRQAIVTAPSFGDNYVIVDLIWQKSGLPYGAAFERRWLRGSGYHNVTVRRRGNSYWSSYSDRGQGWWAFNRKILLSHKSYVESYFYTSPKLRRSKEAKSMRKMIMSISKRRR
jgi:hypothetical protein